MTDKKEVLDYLRNQQKAAEIDAKVNGINFWVLLGAMALIVWHLLGTADSTVWHEHELLLRVLVATQGSVLFVRMCGIRGPQENAIRFTPWRLKDMDAPFLDIINGTILILPVGFLIYFTKDYTAVITGLVGFVFLTSGCAALVRLIRGDDLEGETLPEPSFGNNQRTNSIISICFISGLIFLIIHQSQIAIDLLLEPKIESTKVLAGIAVLYALILLAIQRRASGESIRWTYRLETELLLENITPEIAIRRIEHRALGPKLQDVMDRFFDGLDQKFDLFESLRDDCSRQLKEVSSVPKEYAAERNARIEAATQRCASTLVDLNAEHKKLSDYLSRLKIKTAMEKNSNIVTHIKGIEAKKSANAVRLTEYQGWLDRAKRESAAQ